jgi:ABC-2 type transport system permease protein
VLPPLVIGGVERIAFNTSHFANILLSRMAGGTSTSEPATSMSMDAITPFTLAQLLGSPGLWIGLAIAAAFLAGAIRLRRYRGPI